MNDYKKIHISIGSNIGDKLINLEKAIELIHLKIAVVTSISSTYALVYFQMRPLAI